MRQELLPVKLACCNPTCNEIPAKHEYFCSPSCFLEMRRLQGFRAVITSQPVRSAEVIVFHRGVR